MYPRNYGGVFFQKKRANCKGLFLEEVKKKWLKFLCAAGGGVGGFETGYQNPFVFLTKKNSGNPPQAALILKAGKTIFGFFLADEIFFWLFKKGGQTPNGFFFWANFITRLGGAPKKNPQGGEKPFFFQACFLRYFQTIKNFLGTEAAFENPKKAGKTLKNHLGGLGYLWAFWGILFFCLWICQKTL